MELKNKFKKALIACGILGAGAMLAACSSNTAPVYIATDGNLTVGAGAYKQGEWVNAACNWQTGKVDITSTHITNAIPLKLSEKHFSCDPETHKLIATVNMPQKAK